MVCMAHNWYTNTFKYASVWIYFYMKHSVMSISIWLLLVSMNAPDIHIRLSLSLSRPVLQKKQSNTQNNNKNISIYCVVPLVDVQGNVWDIVCTCSTFLCAGRGSGDGECMHGVIINHWIQFLNIRQSHASYGFFSLFHCWLNIFTLFTFLYLSPFFSLTLSGNFIVGR